MAGGTQATEGHKTHGRLGPKQADCSAHSVIGWLPAVGHTIVLSFSSTLTGTVRLFCSHRMRLNIWLCVRPGLVIVVEASRCS